MSGIQSVSVNATQTYASVSAQSQQSLQPFSNLDLTAAQRTQLRSIFNSAKQNGTSQSDVAQQVDGVLTPAQQQTLQNDIKAGAGGHHHHHESDTSGSQSSAASAESDASTSSTDSTDSTVLTIVSNLQNQSTAANSALINTLQSNVLAKTADSATANAKLNDPGDASANG